MQSSEIREAIVIPQLRELVCPPRVDSPILKLGRAVRSIQVWFVLLMLPFIAWTFVTAAITDEPGYRLAFVVAALAIVPFVVVLAWKRTRGKDS